MLWGLSASKQAQIENLTKAASEACSIDAPAREYIEAAVMMGRLAALESLNPDPIRELRSMPEILNNYDCIIAKIRP
jgi:hypothetical protein